MNAELLQGQVLVLLSGGRDSVCLLDLAVAPRGRGRGAARRLRGAASRAASARSCASGSACRCTWCAPARRTGNLQAWARDVRYAEAERLAKGVIAVGHTATDQVETVLYRLAASPGRRALLGMPERDGRIVRPLLEVTREETAAYCRERGLEWREDPSNDSDAFARNRARHGLVPALRELHPAAEANVLRTLATLRDEAEVLDVVVDAALTDEVARLAALPPALARLCLERLAGAPVGGARSTRSSRCPTGGSLDLGGGLRVVEEYGRLRFERGAPPAPGEPAGLDVPGARRVRRRRAHLRGGRTSRSATARSTSTRSRRRCRSARGSRRPHAPARARRQPLAAGPVHRPARAARAALPHARSWCRPGRSPGCPAWPPARRSASRARTRRRARLDLASIAWRRSAPRRGHRRDPGAGRRPPAPRAGARRGDLARLRGQGPPAGRRAQGRRLLPAAT